MFIKKKKKVVRDGNFHVKQSRREQVHLSRRVTYRVHSGTLNRQRTCHMAAAQQHADSRTKMIGTSTLFWTSTQRTPCAYRHSAVCVCVCLVISQTLLKTLLHIRDLYSSLIFFHTEFKKKKKSKRTRCFFLLLLLWPLIVIFSFESFPAKQSRNLTSRRRSRRRFPTFFFFLFRIQIYLFLTFSIDLYKRKEGRAWLNWALCAAQEEDE